MVVLGTALKTNQALMLQLKQVGKNCNLVLLQ
jgi:hypothetical protein